MNSLLYVIQAPEITTDDIIQDTDTWSRNDRAFLAIKNGNSFIGKYVTIGSTPDLSEAHKIAQTWLDGHIPGLWEFSHHHSKYGFSENPYLYSLKGNGPGISPCLVKRIDHVETV